MSTDSEDVADFLRRIKELNEKRDQEDAERTRKLEEEIMEGRKQREARRLGIHPVPHLGAHCQIVNLLSQNAQDPFHHRNATR